MLFAGVLDWIKLNLQFLRLYRRSNLIHDEIDRLQEILREVVSVRNYFFDNGDLEEKVAREADDQISMSIRALKKELHIIGIQRAKLKLQKHVKDAKR